ncbi:TonB-dependent receptor [Algiphilus sp. W345]|uniref:TonB-dependent receptor n=1 Tax=Banduia mediterranea TaxID=3075609 RepID=A0ABU2WMF3_9GAMM|nr:TonB-dependent receptor [Algiphilus sp. W345]MDT0499056.1 TonB-dependent receptor [Algiphilus sp. W345]
MSQDSKLAASPFLCAFAMALSLGSSAAWAQQAGESSGSAVVDASGDASAVAVEKDADLGSTVVTGTALARSRAIAEKQDALGVVDALGVDELGQLPDKNIGESLNRMPGVSMLVEKGEGRYVQIRGINPSLNNVTINGVQMGSPEAENGGRNAPLDIISGGVLGGVQVIKTPTPDMDAQGIGGTVNVQTKMPFDREDDFYGYATARYGFEDISPRDEAYGGEDPYALEATASGKLADRRLGWLLGASYSDREYIAQGIYQDDWADDYGVPLPVQVKNNYYVIGRERLNVNGALELRPNDSSSYFVRGFYATWDEFQHRNRYQESLTEDVMPDSETSGTSGGERVSPNIRLEDISKTLSSFAAGGENRKGAYTLNYLVQSNHNEIDEPNDYWEFRSAKQFGPNHWGINGDGIVTITPDAGAPDRQDPDLIDFRRARFYDLSAEEDTLIGQLDLRWDRDALSYFKAGLKASQTDRKLDASETRWNAGDQQLTLGTSPDFTNGAFTNDTDAGDVPNIWMDIAAMNRFFDDPANAGYFELNEGDTFTEEYSSDYDLTETILAGYVMGVTEIGRTQIIGGVRVESTDVDSSGYLLDDGEARSVDDGGDYIEWLPALLLNYRPSETVILRAAITRALGRPDYDTIAPRASYSEDTGFGELSVGNPDLEARKAWAYDLSAEWYPNALTLLSAAVFYKDIEDELVSLSERYTTPEDIEAGFAAHGLGGAVDTSELTELTVDTTVNGGSSYLKGLELNGQTQFDFLASPFDGLGLAVNITWLDGETKINGVKTPLQQQPKRSYSFTAFYQKRAFDASVSYTYNDSYPTELNLDDPNANLDQGEFGRWDAKLSYAVTEQLKLFVEGVNLNNEPTSEFQGGRERQATEYEYVGRSVYLGVNLGF